MGDLALFSGTLGLSPPWQVISVNFAKDSNRLDIRVEYVPYLPLVCPICGTQTEVCQAEMKKEIWYHEDFFSYAAYLHVGVPHLLCCGTPFPRPWCRAGSKFSRVFIPL